MGTVGDRDGGRPSDAFFTIALLIRSPAVKVTNFVDDAALSFHGTLERLIPHARESATRSGGF